MKIKLIFAAIIAFFVDKVFAVSGAKKKERLKGQVADHERANDIENRVRDNRADRMRKHDDSGFRED